MTSEIRKVRLGEVCEIKQGRYLAPSQMIHVPGNEGDVPVIGGNGILGYTTSTTHDFDVPLVTCRGSRCGLMQWGASPSWISNNAMAVWFKQGSGDNRFLFYYLRHADFDSVITGSAQPQITVTNLSNLEISLPESRVQVAIGNFLDSLEAKISINRELIELLEQIAQTIFKSWFIDFDPVHAKSRGEEPEGMDAETAALFPDSFEDSELGMIPSGWKCSTVGKSFALTMGQSPPGNAYNESGEGLPFFQGRTDFGQRFPAQRMFSTEGKRAAASGDTLVSVRAPVGDLNQALEPCILGRGLAALRHKSNSESYTYCMAMALQTQLEYFNGEGSVFGAINRKDFEALKCIEPFERLVSKFDELTGAMNEQIRLLHEQALLLKNLQHSLLPRLISGELQIPEELLVD